MYHKILCIETKKPNLAIPPKSENLRHGRLKKGFTMFKQIVLIKTPVRLPNTNAQYENPDQAITKVAMLLDNDEIIEIIDITLKFIFLVKMELGITEKAIKINCRLNTGITLFNFGSSKKAAIKGDPTSNNIKSDPFNINTKLNICLR